MESILKLFIFQDTLVVSFLVLAIAVVAILLLIYNPKTPEAVIKSEITDQDPIESALRRVLGEQRWQQNSAFADANPEMGDPHKMERELLEKDRVIAELNKKLTQGGGAPISDEALLQKLSDLESRLQEYEILEDDIADISLYRSENEKLKEQIEQLKKQMGGAPQVATSEPIVNDEPVSEEVVEVTESEKESGDLVSQFQKIVEHQDKIQNSESEPIHIKGEVASEDGKVIRSTTEEASAADTVHPKLQGVSPDSKEEAEVFINELKSLKKGS